jgi:hypothetical protein
LDVFFVIAPPSQAVEPPANSERFRWTNAQSFAEIANRPTTTSASLEAIIETPHPKMLASAARSPPEAADLAAYILSLKQK